MRTTILTALLVTVLATPALAQSYPVSGKWGESTSSEKGPIDCTDNRRVIDFSGNQRTDSNGGVPTYWNRSVQSVGQSDYRIVDLQKQVDQMKRQLEERTIRADQEIKKFEKARADGQE